MNLRFFRSIILLIALGEKEDLERFCSIRLIFMNNSQLLFGWSTTSTFPSFAHRSSNYWGLQGQRHLRWELQLTSVNKSKTPQREQPEKRGLFRASDLHDYSNIIHKH